MSTGCPLSGPWSPSSYGHTSETNRSASLLASVLHSVGVSALRSMEEGCVYISPFAEASPASLLCLFDWLVGFAVVVCFLLFFDQGFTM